MAVVSVQAEPFDIADEVAAACANRTDVGAVATFTGTVRGGGTPALVAMTLEHYPGMTEDELLRVAAEAEARWPLAAVTIIHRFGRLLPGDPIVLVVAASSHRDAAFDAARFLMDFLKTRAPFWKKEEFADGTSTWVDARETDDAATARWS
jgi:molybdopterin synthase catalytic subunit